MFRVFVVAFLFLQVESLSPPDLNVRNPLSSPDYDIFQYKNNTDKSNLFRYAKTGTFSSTGRPYSAFIALFEPSYFAFLPPTLEGCTEYTKTSVSSNKTWSCEYATNGGFFSFDKTLANRCIGNLMSDGNIIIQEGMNNVNFGIASNGTVITGFVDDSIFTDVSTLTQLISGSGWLVRNGISNVENSPDLNISSSFVNEKAPRTSVGIFSNGTMVLVEVDGEEDINEGPDLFEFAELLSEQLNIQSAINIDGGGSSVSVSNGKVISEPTCNDTSMICERKVQSITCVRKETSL